MIEHIALFAALAALAFVIADDYRTRIVAVSVTRTLNSILPARPAALPDPSRSANRTANPQLEDPSMASALKNATDNLQAAANDAVARVNVQLQNATTPADEADAIGVIEGVTKMLDGIATSSAAPAIPNPAPSAPAATSGL